MPTDIRDYKNLIGLLLGPIRKRPSIFLGDHKISKLQNFIQGYSMAYLMTKSSDTPVEKYFEAPGFIEWFFNDQKLTWSSNWQVPFLKKAKGDEKLALDIYFTYVEKYSKSIKADTKS